MAEAARLLDRLNFQETSTSATSSGSPSIRRCSISEPEVEASTSADSNQILFVASTDPTTLRDVESVDPKLP